MCRVSLLCSALCAECPYYVVLCIQSVLIIQCFICVLTIQCFICKVRRQLHGLVDWFSWGKGKRVLRLDHETSLKLLHAPQRNVYSRFGLSIRTAVSQGDKLWGCVWYTYTLPCSVCANSTYPRFKTLCRYITNTTIYEALLKQDTLHTFLLTVI